MLRAASVAQNRNSDPNVASAKQPNDVLVRTRRKTARSGELPQTRPYKSIMFYCNEVGFGQEIVREGYFPGSGSIIGFG